MLIQFVFISFCLSKVRQIQKIAMQGDFSTNNFITQLNKLFSFLPNDAVERLSLTSVTADCQHGVRQREHPVSELPSRPLFHEVTPAAAAAAMFLNRLRDGQDQ